MLNGASEGVSAAGSRMPGIDAATAGSWGREPSLFYTSAYGMTPVHGRFRRRRYSARHSCRVGGGGSPSDPA